ncbi:hypothetical protein [Parvularcula sp. IMCC14364]|uniref:hypothetical protein n=1 Tax=Parvularcula sp. IMCC14364 TaxID=3067902 RepID=UPI0027404226|nr:hypothetical protein [Parvularcula sp. IMCC14364]
MLRDKMNSPRLLLSTSLAALVCGCSYIPGSEASLQNDIAGTATDLSADSILADINYTLADESFQMDLTPVATYASVEFDIQDTWAARQSHGTATQASSDEPDEAIIALALMQPPRRQNQSQSTDAQPDDGLLSDLEAALEGSVEDGTALYVETEDWSADSIVADINRSLASSPLQLNLATQVYYDPDEYDPATRDTINGGIRRRPGRPARIGEQNRVAPPNLDGIQPPTAYDLVGDPVPIPDRWRLASNLGLVNHNLLNPYGQNTLKGDRPIKGTDDWFIALSGISDTIIEPRTFPVPVGVQTTELPGRLDVFGDAYSFVAAQTFIAQAALIKGSTAFKPQDYEYRITAAFNYNYVDINEKRVLFVEPSKGSTRRDGWIGIQEAFVDYHIRNVSDRYDFDSLRFGIQPFNTDFRGFLFQDNQFGIRFFGNRDNNRWQYNLAAFARLEKDTNSGLNDITSALRDDYVFAANAFRQDFPFPGMTSQGTIVYNMNREKDDVQIDDNGFPVRPALLGSIRGRDYDAVYLGYNMDGRWKRMNWTSSVYYALGENRNSIFTDQPADINAYFVAVEPSVDYNWIRLRLSGMYASGDDDPYDDEEKGFDAIFENPQFAGADTSYWIRQTIPFAGGGRVISVNGRNGVLNSLRSSKEQGQSNFTNPGTILLGAGADFDVTPPLRISLNANHLWFEDTSSLEALRIQGNIAEDIGWDVSVSTIYRPRFIQNFVFRLSGAALVPGDGFDDLFENKERDDYYYSILFNGTVTY